MRITEESGYMYMYNICGANIVLHEYRFIHAINIRAATLPNALCLIKGRKRESDATELLSVVNAIILCVVQINLRDTYYTCIRYVNSHTCLCITKVTIPTEIITTL